ncbi:hypothetical protein KGM_207096 [Danaus plexippus plexippus]|uniref:Uncharacterized protein n=1 Tax=Danaus plexippus plexippus TaxID=278856 RepID=A0A212FMU9_DANPL|nr:hypothetical protein KGM_207096 [Danaus plexippus plexippus]
MMLSMWCTDTMTCGIMMPIMKAVLGELERMGVLEIFEPHKLGDSSRYDVVVFPKSPNLEAPHFTLLTLPGVLLMEICLYLWLNFYFLGMMRVQNYSSLQASLTSEEQQYVGTLLEAQYTRLGRISLHEMSILTKINPRYLMIGATLTISLPFHLLPASPAYAMVAAYAGIPPSKMMIAGIGPSVAAILINLFTTTVWSKVIWPDVDTYPD